MYIQIIKFDSWVPYAKTRGALLKKILVPMLDARGAAIRHIFKLVSAMQLVCHLKSLTVQFFNQLHRRN